VVAAVHHIRKAVLDQSELLWDKPPAGDVVLPADHGLGQMAGDRASSLQSVTYIDQLSNLCERYQAPSEQTTPRKSPRSPMMKEPRVVTTSTRRSTGQGGVRFLRAPSLGKDTPIALLEAIARAPTMRPMKLLPEERHGPVLEDLGLSMFIDGHEASRSGRDVDFQRAILEATEALSEVERYIREGSQVSASPRVTPMMRTGSDESSTNSVDNDSSWQAHHHPVGASVRNAGQARNRKSQPRVIEHQLVSPFDSESSSQRRDSENSLPTSQRRDSENSLPTSRLTSTPPISESSASPLNPGYSPEESPRDAQPRTFGVAPVGANSAFSRPVPKIPKMDLSELASNSGNSSNGNSNSSTHAELQPLGLLPHSARRDPHARPPHQVGSARPTRSDASPQAQQNPGVAQLSARLDEKIDHLFERDASPTAILMRCREEQASRMADLKANMDGMMQASMERILTPRGMSSTEESAERVAAGGESPIVSDQQRRIDEIKANMDSMMQASMERILTPRRTTSEESAGSVASGGGPAAASDRPFAIVLPLPNVRYTEGQHGQQKRQAAIDSNR